MRLGQKPPQTFWLDKPHTHTTIYSMAESDEGTHVVVWMNENNEFQGSGKPLTKFEAEEYAKKKNKKYPGFKHTIIPKDKIPSKNN